MNKKKSVEKSLDMQKVGYKLPELIENTYRDWEHKPQLSLTGNSDDVETAAQHFLLYVILPAWFAPGILDYVMHRRTKIELTSGTREALIHCMMMTEVGIPILMALLLEVNPLMLTLMSGAVVAHEATAFWDVQTALDGKREIRPNEQHIHSFLEVMPIMAVSFTAILHWKQVKAIFGVGKQKSSWQLHWKEPRLSKGYLAGIVVAIIGFIVLPYAEEIIRCLKNNRPQTSEESKENDAITKVIPGNLGSETEPDGRIHFQTLTSRLKARRGPFKLGSKG